MKVSKTHHITKKGVVKKNPPKSKWIDMNPNIRNESDGKEFITKKGNRIFKLKYGRNGTLGIGNAYYLSTKLVSESEFFPVTTIITNNDNHGSAIDKRLTLVGAEYSKYWNGDINDVFKIANTYIKQMF